ncbi:MAG: hypothetical protein ABIB97_00515 [Patescibacteria group bacterium]
MPERKQVGKGWHLRIWDAVADKCVKEWEYQGHSGTGSILWNSDKKGYSIHMNCCDGSVVNSRSTRFVQFQEPGSEEWLDWYDVCALGPGYTLPFSTMPRETIIQISDTPVPESLRRKDRQRGGRVGVLVSGKVQGTRVTPDGVIITVRNAAYRDVPVFARFDARVRDGKRTYQIYRWFGNKLGLVTFEAYCLQPTPPEEARAKWPIGGKVEAAA